MGQSRGLHVLKIEARTRDRLTRAAQLNLEPEPEIFFPPTTNIQLKKKAAFQGLHGLVTKQIHKETDSSMLGHFTRQNNKHLPVMKVCDHQVQRLHTFCRGYEWLYGQDNNYSTVQIMVILVS